MAQKYRKSVFIVVYSKQGNKTDYLILKRKKHWRGWEFPKGGIEKSEKIIDSVKREIVEETGLKALKIKKFNVHGKYNYRKKFPDRPGFIGQTYSLFAVNVEKEKVDIDEKEHSKYRWLDFKKAHEKLTFPNQKRCLRIVDEWMEKNKKTNKNPSF